MRLALLGVGIVWGVVLILSIGWALETRAWRAALDVRLAEIECRLTWDEITSRDVRGAFTPERFLSEYGCVPQSQR